MKRIILVFMICSFSSIIFGQKPIGVCEEIIGEWRLLTKDLSWNPDSEFAEMVMVVRFDSLIIYDERKVVYQGIYGVAKAKSYELGDYQINTAFEDFVSFTLENDTLVFYGDGEDSYVYTFIRSPSKKEQPQNQLKRQCY